MSESRQLGNVPLKPPVVPEVGVIEAAEVLGVRRQNLNLVSDDRGEVREPLWSQVYPVLSQNIQSPFIGKHLHWISTPSTHGYQDAGSMPNSARVGNWNIIAANLRNGEGQLAGQFPTGNPESSGTSKGLPRIVQEYWNNSQWWVIFRPLLFTLKYMPDKFDGTAEWSNYLEHFEEVA